MLKLKLIKSFVALFLFLFFLLSVVFFTAPGCSVTKLPPAVCNYGSAICETAEFLCATVPNIPPQVCTYINLACLNLNILCESEPGSDDHEKALQSLKVINDNMRRYLLEKTIKDTTGN